MKTRKPATDKWGWALWMLLMALYAAFVLVYSVLIGARAHGQEPTPAVPALEDRETTWTKYLAAKYSWRDDVRAWDGSLPDLVTATHAIEVDWAKHKWKEAIGQAFDYAATTGRKPGVLLLVKDLAEEKSDLYRAERACREAGVLLLIYDCKFDRWLMPVDVEQLPGK